MTLTNFSLYPTSNLLQKKFLVFCNYLIFQVSISNLSHSKGARYFFYLRLYSFVFVKSFFTSFYKFHLEGYLDHMLLKQDEFDKE